MFVILQKYDFSSKSQHWFWLSWSCCDVCDTAKVRFFKQITTLNIHDHIRIQMFVILQKYDFSSKSQLHNNVMLNFLGCLWYCKSTIFQANHNSKANRPRNAFDVCDTAKVRFFKQITTNAAPVAPPVAMFVILQKYDFSSKSQRLVACPFSRPDVCDTAKVRFFKQITTACTPYQRLHQMFVILQKYDFSSKSQPDASTIDHKCDVCDTAKVRFFKQITTADFKARQVKRMFVILQKYDFSSKSQHRFSVSNRTRRCLWYCKSTIFQANHNRGYKRSW